MIVYYWFVLLLTTFVFWLVAIISPTDASMLLRTNQLVNSGLQPLRARVPKRTTVKASLKNPLTTFDIPANLTLKDVQEKIKQAQTTMSDNLQNIPLIEPLNEGEQFDFAPFNFLGQETLFFSLLPPGLIQLALEYKSCDLKQLLQLWKLGNGLSLFNLHYSNRFITLKERLKSVKTPNTNRQNDVRLYIIDLVKACLNHGIFPGSVYAYLKQDLDKEVFDGFLINDTQIRMIVRDLCQDWTVFLSGQLNAIFNAYISLNPLQASLTQKLRFLFDEFGSYYTMKQLYIVLFAHQQLSLWDKIQFISTPVLRGIYNPVRSRSKSKSKSPSIFYVVELKNPQTNEILQKVGVCDFTDRPKKGIPLKEWIAKSIRKRLAGRLTGALNYKILRSEVLVGDAAFALEQNVLWRFKLFARTGPFGHEGQFEFFNPCLKESGLDYFVDTLRHELITSKFVPQKYIQNIREFPPEILDQTGAIKESYRPIFQRIKKLLERFQKKTLNEKSRMKLKRLLRRVGLLKDGVSMTESTLRVNQQYSYSNVDPLLLKHFRDEMIHNLNLFFDSKGRLMCQDESSGEIISLTKENVKSQTTNIFNPHMLETGFIGSFYTTSDFNLFKTEYVVNLSPQHAVYYAPKQPISLSTQLITANRTLTKSRIVVPTAVEKIAIKIKPEILSHPIDSNESLGVSKNTMVRQASDGLESSPNSPKIPARYGSIHQSHFMDNMSYSVEMLNFISKSKDVWNLIVVDWQLFDIAQDSFCAVVVVNYIKHGFVHLSRVISLKSYITIYTIPIFSGFVYLANVLIIQTRSTQMVGLLCLQVVLGFILPKIETKTSLMISTVYFATLGSLNPRYPIRLATSMVFAKFLQYPMATFFSYMQSDDVTFNQPIFTVVDVDIIFEEALGPPCLDDIWRLESDDGLYGPVLFQCSLSGLNIQKTQSVHIASKVDIQTIEEENLWWVAKILDWFKGAHYFD